MGARRDMLKDVSCQQGTHPGLWLDRYLQHQTGDPRPDPADANVKKEAKATLVREVASIRVPDDYAKAFERWKALLEADGSVTLVEATAVGRVVVGLGAKGAAEIGIRLDPTWGVPVLPGSALKGLAATTAHRLLAEDSWHKDGEEDRPGESHRELFGTTDEQGLVHFLDALWVPVPGGSTHPLQADVMTSHHQDYYTTGRAPPADTDSPNPIAFLSATGRFLLAVQAADEAWREAALDILALGLAELGIGAKTNAGYGRLEVDGRGPMSAPPPPAGPDLQAVGNLVMQINAGTINDIVTRAKDHLDDDSFLAFADAAIARVGKKAFKKKLKAGKRWAVMLQEAIQGGQSADGQTPG